MTNDVPNGTKPAINAIILENEKPETLVTFLEQYCPHVNVLGIGATISEGVRLIKEATAPIDVAFLDIRLDDGLVFEIFKHLDKVTFDVIFTTAWEEYFQQACGYYSIGYLLKPFDPKELVEAVNKVRVYRKEGTDQLEHFNESLRMLLSHLNQTAPASSYPIPTVNGFSFVNLNDVIRLEGFDNYTQIHIKTQKNKLTTSRTIKTFEKVLSGYGFFRCHKQHIINLHNIIEYVRADNIIVMSDGARIPLARRRKTEFLKIIRNTPFA